MDHNTNEFFINGKLSVVLDGGAGSSGKGKLGAYLVKHSDRVKFACNTFSRNASHTVVEEEDGERKEYVYKVLNNCAHLHDKLEKFYIGHGACFKVDDLMKELVFTGLPPEKLGISPTATIVQDIDEGYERGDLDMAGNPKNHNGTIKTGTTASGSGAARARKILRKKNVMLARDVPEFEPYLCDVTEEIMDRLGRGQAGLLEVAQGFQLSYGLDEFYPYTTSRNCTVAAGLDDMMLPPSVIGHVCLNFRTFPIRIHSKKYIAKGHGLSSVNGSVDRVVALQKAALEHKDEYPEGQYDYNVENDSITIRSVGTDELVRQILRDGTHLTWEQVQSGLVPYDVIESYSGNFYEDQEEIDWDYLTEKSGADRPIMECTTLTKLPRRVATFSKRNLKEAILHNQTIHKVFISVNFLNYLDWSLYKVQNNYGWDNELSNELPLVEEWINRNITSVIEDMENVELRWLGTSEYTDDMITYSNLALPIE